MKTESYLVGRDGKRDHKLTAKEIAAIKSQQARKRHW